MEINRRNFIRLIGGTVGGIALGAYGFAEALEIPSRLIEKVKDGPGIVGWKSTVCGFCPGGCGLKIKTIDGLPVYAKGNSNYPVNTGGVCPMAHGSLELLYHHERIKTPMRRIGVGGSGKFEHVSWDEALNIISNKMNKIRTEGKPERMAFIGDSESDLEEQFINYFLQIFGSPNYYKNSFYNNSTAANILQFGKKITFNYDITNSNVVLLLGSNILETESAPVYHTKLLSSRKSDDSRKFKLIHAGSLLNASGMYADKWVSVKPGTLGALSLGIAYVMIREELIDDDFVKNDSFGFFEWEDKSGNKRNGFKNYVLSEYYPEKVSEITGVPSAVILDIARELGNNKPSIVIGGDEVLQTENGMFSMMAVNALNALLGNFGKNGNVSTEPESPFNNITMNKNDFVAQNGLKSKKIADDIESKYPFSEFSSDSFASNVLNDSPYPLELLFLYRGNIVFNSLNKHQLTEALRKIPLIVSFDSFVNETNIFADLILPINSFMEEWNVISSVPGVKFQHVGIRQPVVKKFYDTKQVPDILIKLSRKLDSKVSKAIRYDSYLSLIKKKTEELFLSGKGAITTERISGLWLEYINSRGWHVGRYQSFDEFWNLMLENGGWWNPLNSSFDKRKMFKTKSRKFEFYSLALEKLIGKPEKQGGTTTAEKIKTLNISARGEEVYLPHYEPQSGNGDYPYHLIMYRMNVNKDGSSANIPLMQELFGLNVRHYWDSWAEINSSAAKKMGIKDNDYIWVTSDIGSLKLKAKITEGVMKNTIAIPFGMGHTSYGKYADGFGKNPTSIMKNNYDMLSGMPAYLSTKVKISKISGGV